MHRGGWHRRGERTYLYQLFLSGQPRGDRGGALRKQGFGVLAVLNNCVFWDNGSFDAFFGESDAVANHTLFDATMNRYSGSNNLTTTVNPFVSSTSTMLRPCSPAIDAGSDAAYTGPATDLPGNPRTFGGTIDMGAYEYQSAPPVITAMLSGNAIIMPGETGSLTVDISGGTAPYSVVYSDGSTNQTVSNYQSGADIPISQSQTTTYTLVSVTDANGCTATTSGSVTVQDVRCGNKNQNVQIGYYGVSQCVSEKIAQRYLKLGATLGGCNSNVPTRIGYELEAAESALSLRVKAYPNPTRGMVNVEVYSVVAGAAQFAVLDLAGRAVQQKTQELSTGVNEVLFDLSGRTPGTYLIRCVDAGSRQAVVRVNKQ